MKSITVTIVVVAVIGFAIWGSVSYQASKTKGDFVFILKNGTTIQAAKDYIQSAIAWKTVDGKTTTGDVESNSNFEKREIGNYTYYFGLARHEFDDSALLTRNTSGLTPHYTVQHSPFLLLLSLRLKDHLIG